MAAMHAGGYNIALARLRGQPSLVASIEAWMMLRRPFPIPRRLRTHSCSEHWESIDIDVAGCRQCGAVHLCVDAHSIGSLPIPEKLIAPHGSVFCGLREIHVACAAVHDTSYGETASVCSVTGFCVRDVCFTESKFDNNVCVQNETLSSPRRRSKFDPEVMRVYVDRLLSSSDALRCHRHECDRVCSKLTHMLLRLLKEYKARAPGRRPNLVVVASDLAYRFRNTRLCETRFDSALRMRCARVCKDALVRLVVVLERVCPSISDTVRVEALVTGLLYLMRAGLKMRGVSLLPMVPALNMLLPLESNLQPFFGLRPKSITEVENIVKMNLRSLDLSTAYTLCVQSSDDMVCGSSDNKFNES